MSDDGRHIAILGAGPIGLEAALAAVDAGMPFTLYERGAEVAANVRDWGHVNLFSPWDLDVSPRARRHLGRAGHQVPAGSGCPTGAELVATVLEPLARLPEIRPRLELETRVVAIGREGLLKHEAIGDPERERHPFRLLVEGPEARERIEHADVVIDCTGSYERPNALGEGGIPAPGEGAVEDRIVRRIPDVGADRTGWTDRSVLLVGAGHSAQTAARDLAELARAVAAGGGSENGPGVIWAVREPEPDWGRVEDDPLPARARLAETAAELAAGGSAAIEVRPGRTVAALAPVPAEDSARGDPAPGHAGRGAGGRVRVTLRSVDGDTEIVEVDRILALTGSVGDHLLYRQLQVHECWATSGPMKLAASLLGSASDDCLAQESPGPEALENPEPGFFILGAKSYGRNSAFLMRSGWEQVDDVFELLRHGSGSRE